MTNTQLYFAIGIPCFTILASLIISLVQWWGVKDSVGDVKAAMREMREDIREIRSDIKMIVSKIAEMDTRLTVIEERGR